MVEKSGSLVVVSWIVFTAACSALPGVADSPRPTSEIRSARSQWNAALLERDTAVLARLVDDSATHVSPRFVHAGRKAFLELFIRNMAARPAFVLTYSPERITTCDPLHCGTGAGDFATEYGQWKETWLEQGEPTEIRGTYYTIWRRRGSEWKMATEVFATQFCRGRSYCNR